MFVSHYAVIIACWLQARGLRCLHGTGWDRASFAWRTQADTRAATVLVGELGLVDGLLLLKRRYYFSKNNPMQSRFVRG